MNTPRRAMAGIATLAVVGVGWAGYAAQADDPSYRTARATTGDVEETLDLAGTVEPAGRADLAFATSGTVARVAVETGERVRAGQTLGTLDDETLRRAVQAARATLAGARAQLESDVAAQTAAVSGADSGSSEAPQSDQGAQGAQEPRTPQGPTVPATPAPSATPDEEPEEPEEPEEGSDALADLAQQQRAVIAAQSTVSASLAAAQQALEAQQAACVDVTGQGCTDALAAVQAAQRQVATDQQALQDALDALGGTLSAAAGGGSADAVAATTAREPAIVLVAETTPTGGAGGGVSGTVTAATLARDQASIDQARADLVAAGQQLATAAVTAPLSGKVVAVDAGVGDSVAAGTDVFVLVSQGTTTVRVAATSTQVQRLEVGQRATATPAGAEKALAGTVTQVSSVPDDDATYAVTITLKRKRLDIATGLTATVAVVTGSASDVVTVPASAVSDGTVTVLEDGAATPTPVTTGVTGGTRVEITEGLSKGDEVVLADLDRALPSGDTRTGELRSGGGGAPGGGMVRFRSGPGGMPMSQ
ncbi:HlyD family efflux transporter periplasmic adaptor subunit [Nocardioides sp. YIM 152315]|uniref:efflux RND transporter periplasmic adaptor subunit n=1 Tax=Nocardioides sp. YIM 152315 TaxID=3031760 RepID=UPI0023DA8CB4|nr:HlyD family efflux transporter periplasmic adaptor subunit [Nocardioides sp. YIM 152315]MDF1602705.1 HlyD family efflux transporter periplasmic adaptor subunit [Nocardioides sp. YIM 152315]